jgi:hypothetical protein
VREPRGLGCSPLHGHQVACHTEIECGKAGHGARRELPLRQEWLVQLLLTSHLGADVHRTVFTNVCNHQRACLALLSLRRRPMAASCRDVSHVGAFPSFEGQKVTSLSDADSSIGSGLGGLGGLGEGGGGGGEGGGGGSVVVGMERTCRRCQRRGLRCRQREHCRWCRRLRATCRRGGGADAEVGLDAFQQSGVGVQQRAGLGEVLGVRADDVVLDEKRLELSCTRPQSTQQT